MYVSKEEIERVRRQHDLVEVIRSRGVALTRRGRNWVGLCPFHSDREPSLVVNPDKQLWNCFGA
ncbi:MAG: CHC2 zinc finger domain-containing protein, partial [Thermoanaerobaculia bacterium]